eukprot:1825871-Pyramimonas_sp.AAC.1
MRSCFSRRLRAPVCALGHGAFSRQRGGPAACAARFEAGRPFTVAIFRLGRACMPARLGGG